MKKWILCALLSLSCLLVPSVSLAAASKYDSILQKWSQYREFKDQGASLTVHVTYYSAEYIEALCDAEAEKNLWTANEREDYKYTLLQTLRLEEFIPVLFEFENYGPSLHMAPFDSFVTLRIGNKDYKPVEYDTRLNFKLQGKRDGLAFFPRYDEKSGKSLLESAKMVRVDISGSIGDTTAGKDIQFVWNVSGDDSKQLAAGRAAARAEADRLIKRMAKLRTDKQKLDEQLAALQTEIDTIQARLDELQKL